MNDNKEKWFVEKGFDVPPSGNLCTVLKVKKDNNAFTPVAVVATPVNWEGSDYENEVIRKANLIAAAPEMLDLLKTIYMYLSEGTPNEIIDYEEDIEATISLAEKNTL